MTDIHLYVLSHIFVGIISLLVMSWILEAIVSRRKAGKSIGKFQLNIFPFFLFAGAGFFLTGLVIKIICWEDKSSILSMLFGLLFIQIASSFSRIVRQLAAEE